MRSTQLLYLLDFVWHDGGMNPVGHHRWSHTESQRVTLSLTMSHIPHGLCKPVNFVSGSGKVSNRRKTAADCGLAYSLVSVRTRMASNLNVRVSLWTPAGRKYLNW